MSEQYQRDREPYLVPLPGCMIRQSTAQRISRYQQAHPIRLSVLLDEALRDYLDKKAPENPGDPNLIL